MALEVDELLFLIDVIDLQEVVILFPARLGIVLGLGL